MDKKWICWPGRRSGAALIALIALVSGCSNSDEVPGFAALERHIRGNRVGADTDQWIEMKNTAGEWERTGLIFGYTDDYGECAKAIEGLKKVNYSRRYRCAPAN